jgi:hypothetical protein
MMLSRPDFSACPVEQVDKFKGTASRAVPKLQHLPRWGMPPSSLPSPAGNGNNSARSTVINTARSMIIHGCDPTDRADIERHNITGKGIKLEGNGAGPSHREDMPLCAPHHASLMGRIGLQMRTIRWVHGLHLTSCTIIAHAT